MEREWTVQQDNAIISIANSLEKPINWKMILPVLRQQSGCQTRSAKECRQRWTYLLDINSQNLNWTQKQQDLLLAKHTQFGNKWLQLSRFFPERSQNFLKNQFYSIFRRSLRRANKQLYLFRKNSIRPITTTIVLRVLAISQQKFAQKSEHPEALIKAACQFREVLAEYYRPCENKEMNQERVTRFLKKVTVFRSELRIMNTKIRKERAPPLKPRVKKERVIYNHRQNGQLGQKKEQVLKVEKKAQSNESCISSTLLHSQPCVQHSSVLPTLPISNPHHHTQSPLQPMLPMFFPKISFVQFGGIVQQQINVPQFPLQPPFFQNYPNCMFTMIKQVPLSLQNSMLYYGGIVKQEVTGLSMSMGMGIGLGVGGQVGLERSFMMGSHQLSDVKEEEM